MIILRTIYKVAALIANVAERGRQGRRWRCWCRRGLAATLAACPVTAIQEMVLSSLGIIGTESVRQIVVSIEIALPVTAGSIHFRNVYAATLAAFPVTTIQEMVTSSLGVSCTQGISQISVPIEIALPVTAGNVDFRNVYATTLAAFLETTTKKMASSSLGVICTQSFPQISVPIEIALPVTAGNVDFRNVYAATLAAFPVTTIQEMVLSSLGVICTQGNPQISVPIEITLPVTARSIH